MNENSARIKQTPYTENKQLNDITLYVQIYFWIIMNHGFFLKRNYTWKGNLIQIVWINECYIAKFYGNL